MAAELTKAEQNALCASYDVMGTHVELDLPFVKKYLVRGRSELVSDQEIVFFMNTCKQLKLNPTVGGEIYLIKYSKDDPAQTVIGKETYMRRAWEHPNYLFKEDGIVVQRGNQIIQKEGCCLYPGEALIGGWCRVHFMRQDVERTAFKEVAFAEYNKGSVSAQLGERFIIPINMRDGSLLCTGKGNPDWNYSAPHGAGRLMSRSAAKEAFTVDEFAKQMEGIYTTSVGQSTLDECPMAYKGMDDIVNNIGPTAQIDAIIKPIYNFKAGD